MESPSPYLRARFGTPLVKKPSPFGQLMNKRRGRRDSGDETPHAAFWMVNFADLMTEMFCLFVVLYAFSAALNKNIQDVRKQVEDIMEKDRIQGQVELKKDGISVSLQEGEHLSFFESGETILTLPGLEILEKVVPILLKAQGEIIVEGHTDSVPIRNDRFGSNWELSTARATHVVRYLIDQKGFSPKHLAAIGYGENRPVADNSTPEGRAKNRRVVFFIKTGAESSRDLYKPEVVQQLPPTAPAVSKQALVKINALVQNAYHWMHPEK